MADYLTIAGAVLGVDPEDLLRYAKLPLAESALASPAAAFGGTEFYPDLHMKVAVLGWHLIKNHPLPDGNKRAGFMAMVEFAERNGRVWSPPAADSESDGDETVRVIEEVAAGAISEEALAEWVQLRIGSGGSG